MSVIDIFKRWRAPESLHSPFSDSTNFHSITLDHLLNIDEADLPMSRSQAMSIPALARARNVLVGLASRLPLLAINAEGVMSDQPWITRKPESGVPRSITISWTLDQLIFYGAAYWVIRHRDYANRPQIVQLVDINTIDFNEAGYPVGVNNIPIPTSEFIRIDAPHEGVLTYGCKALRENLALANAARNAATNPVPSVELHQTSQTPTLTEEEKSN